ncbi:TIGR03943 family putative permease subunit [Actinomycetospora cinnamomea]|uniref:Putative repeat protein (TIGR03943 family) n=1 Tax=Actinomycetospora cinnamomea TaxID=663609 RepID=A0A2U1F0S3_9PSEU|nr:TIGR03943 family protein [Actinomycetospora cinnamomea]PVZ05787.1 putative repeat protein (TIGR03943 family) [Actinomycetospora cinnamomea]
MRRDAQHVLLVLVGGVLVKIVLDGSYLRYVRAWSAAPVLAAGVVLITVALIALARDLRRPTAPPSGEDDHDHDHGPDARAGPAAWLMVLPVLALLLVVPPALGSAALRDTGARTAPAAAAPADEPLPPGDAPPLGLLDVVSRTAADPHGTITERDVTVTGFLVPAARTPPPGATGLDVARLVISCCAADASAVRLHLADPADLLAGVAPGGAEGDRWVAIRGRVVAGTGTPADGHVPTLSVIGWSPVAAPVPVYEY